MEEFEADQATGDAEERLVDVGAAFLADAQAAPDEPARSLKLLREWSHDPVVLDARKRRNASVHHHYEKRPYKPMATSVLDELTASVYSGRRQLCLSARSIGAAEPHVR